MSKQKPICKKKPDAEDYEGALSFLSLIYPDAKAHRLLRLFRKAKTVEHAAKDLLRASNLPLLSREEAHVEADLTRIRKGKDLSPRDLIFLREQDASIVASPPQLSGPIIYEFRVAHR